METLTKVYERHDVARQVVNELEAAGFPSSSISLVANKGISDRYDDGDDSSNAGAGAGATPPRNLNCEPLLCFVHFSFDLGSASQVPDGSDYMLDEDTGRVATLIRKYAGESRGPPVAPCLVGNCRHCDLRHLSRFPRVALIV